MRNRTFIHTMIGGLVLAFALFVQAAPGFAQTRLAALPGDGQVTLSWGPVEGASSYNLSFATERDFNESSPGFTKLTGVTSGITQTGLVNGTEYFFVVTAITAAGEKPVAPDVHSTPSANVTAALAGVNAFFSQVRSVLNEHNPPVKNPSDLSYAHLAGFFDAAFLDEGRDGVSAAKRMAQENRDSPAIDGLVIDHVNFYDETNQVISVAGVATIGGMSEFVGGFGDGFFVLKRQADTATWLSYGDQRIVKGHFQVEMRTDRQPYYNAGPRQHVNFDIEAPIGTVTSASVNVPGMASPLSLQQGQVRIETIVGDLAQSPEVIERDAFFGGFDPGTTVQSGTTYTLNLTKAAGGSVTYPLVFRGIAVTDPVAGAIEVTSPTGHALADAHLGSPLTVQWTSPTAYQIDELRLDGNVMAQDFGCYIDNHAQMLPSNATSGTITFPTLCNGQPVISAYAFVSAYGANGQRSAFTYGFSDQTTGGGTTTTTTTTTGSTTTITGSTTTTTLGGAGGAVTLNFVAGWNLVGNSIDAILDVAATFADATKLSTVWKWVASKSSWAFYTPTLGDGGAAYASGKGYDFLTSINAGEGFWVNAKAPFTAQLPSGSAIYSASFQNMAPGWNLIAVGDSPTPSAFNKTLSLTPPAAGEIPLNVTTLWAWDSTQSNWYFYAPSLEKSGGLTNYIQSKNYLDFGTKKLDPTMGFWVNKPQ